MRSWNMFCSRDEESAVPRSEPVEEDATESNTYHRTTRRRNSETAATKSSLDDSSVPKTTQEHTVPAAQVITRGTAECVDCHGKYIDVLIHGYTFVFCESL